MAWQNPVIHDQMEAMQISSDTPPPIRPVIYQLMVRTFGNTNETRKTHGTLIENGCGKFNDITLVALRSLKEMGFTHLWLTGVLEQASGTDYPERPADDPDILKGIAGSPYAIKDYFDVCPDYAWVVEERMSEFQSLVGRCHSLGLKVIIDCVPNHVARSYASEVRPDSSFGLGDKCDVFSIVTTISFILVRSIRVEVRRSSCRRDTCRVVMVFSLRRRIAAGSPATT